MTPKTKYTPSVHLLHLLCYPTIVKLSRNSLSTMDVTSACDREYMEAAEAAGYDTLQDTEFGKALRPIFKDIT